MDFLDRVLKCNDCGGEFVFTAGEQLFFFDKQFKNDPKRCKPCKAKRTGVLAARAGPHSSTILVANAFRTETRTECSACGVGTTVPFKPTQGRPVLCRQCFQLRRASGLSNSTLSPSATQTQATAQMNAATAELVAAASGAEHLSGVQVELAAPSLA